MVIQIAEALDTTVNVLLGEETPEPKEHGICKSTCRKAGSAEGTVFQAR